MSTKSKSTLSETHSNKGSPATPSTRVNKITRGATKPDAADSPLLKPKLSMSPRVSLEGSRPLNSKPSIERRSSKLTTPPEKQQIRASKESVLQSQINLLQEDLKKTKDHLLVVEKEKTHALEELKGAQKLAEDATEKLKEALAAQKRAEDDSEVEKFRALEIEQVGIEARQKEDEWRRETDTVKKQHELGVASLLSTTQELEKVKQELSVITNAKNQAAKEANDAAKNAEINAEKVEVLSVEINHLKVLLDSKHEMKTNESNMVFTLNEKIESLEKKLKKAKSFEGKLLEREAYIEKLNVDLETANMAESYSRNLLEEWKVRIEELENNCEVSTQIEKSAKESLVSLEKKLEDKNRLLRESESEVSSLKKKLGLMEMSIEIERRDLDESQCLLGQANEEVSKFEKMTESLKSELEKVKEEKLHALKNENLAASTFQSLLEEKNYLINELENSKDEEEKSKKAMESLAAALHEVSSEAREAKEKLLVAQVESERYDAEIEDLKSVVQATSEKYETILEIEKHEIDLLTQEIEQLKNSFLTSKAEWEQKEVNLVNCIKQTEEETSSKEKEINRLVILLKETEEEATAIKEEGSMLRDNINEAESEIHYLKEILGDAKAESMELKENLLDKENEMLSVVEENEDLKKKEAELLKKVTELSKLLEEEATFKKTAEETVELSDTEKDYDLLPKVVEFSEENGHLREDKPKKSEEPVKEILLKNTDFANEGIKNFHAGPDKFENGSEKPKKEDFQMWESCKIEEKEYSPERGTETSFDEEVDSKIDGGESFDTLSENLDNGGSSPLKQQQELKKKKKPFLGKFGTLLKKKSPSPQE